MSDIIASEVTVGTAAVALVVGDADGRVAIVSNTSDAIIYLGGSSVTTAAGFPVGVGGVLSFNTPPGETMTRTAFPFTPATAYMVSPGGVLNDSTPPTPTGKPAAVVTELPPK